MIEYNDPYGNLWKLGIKLDHYANNDNLYVGLIVAEPDDEGDTFPGEPYGDLSVNIEPLPENYIAVDCTYGPHDEIIEDNNLGVFTGRYLSSGYCTYPIYEMDMNELRKHLYQ